MREAEVVRCWLILDKSVVIQNTKTKQQQQQKNKNKTQIQNT